MDDKSHSRTPQIVAASLSPREHSTQAVDDGSKLVVVNSFAQRLYTVNPDTGVAVLLDLGGELLPGAGGDGLVSI